MRYLSSANIKSAAAEQPDPERTKNLLGKIMPIHGGVTAGAGSFLALNELTNLALRRAKIKNPKVYLGALPLLLAGSGALGYTAGKTLQDLPTKSLPEIFLKSPNDIKSAAAEQPDPERVKNLLGQVIMPGLGGAIAFETVQHVLEDLVGPFTSGALGGIAAYKGYKKLQDINAKKLPEILLKSPNDIKSAAAEQPDPERTKNLFGKLMPIYGGLAAGAGSYHAIDELTGLALHLAKIKDQRVHLAASLPLLLGTGAAGYGTYKHLQDLPTKSLHEIFLNPKQSTK